MTLINIITKTITTIITATTKITQSLTKTNTPQPINTPHTLSLLLNQHTKLQSQINSLQDQINKLNNPNLTEEQIEAEEQFASRISPTQTELQTLEQIIYTFLPHPIFFYKEILEDDNHPWNPT